MGSKLSCKIDAPAKLGAGKEVFRRNSQREIGVESLRWSTTALPSNRDIKAKKTTGAPPKSGLGAVLCQDILPVARVQDRRLSRGSTVSLLSMASSNSSSSEEEPGSLEKRDAISQKSIAHNSMMIGAGIPQFPFLQDRPEPIALEARAPVPAPSTSVNLERSQIRNSDAAPALLKAVASTTNGSGYEAPPSTDSAGISNFSSALHERLALLEGKVSLIAAELRKTKEMLDTNHPTGSVLLLSDIQGKISSIERAMTSRLSEVCDLEVSPFLPTPDDIMEDEPDRSTSQHQTASRLLAAADAVEACRSGASEQDVEEAAPRRRVEADFVSYTNGNDRFPWAATTGSSRLASEQDALLSVPPSSDGPTSAPPKAVKSTLDHQALEDRLFPHRKLLKSRLSLHQRVVESRAALHSKLGENVPLEAIQGQKQNPGDEGDLIAAEFLTSLKQAPSVGHGELRKMKALVAGMGSGAMPTAKRSHIPEGGSHCLGGIAGNAEKKETGIMGSIDKGVVDAAVQRSMQQQVFKQSVSEVLGGAPAVVKFDRVLPSEEQPKSGAVAKGVSGGARSQGVDPMDDNQIYLECDESLPSNDNFDDQENNLPADSLQSPTDDIEYEDYPTDRLLQIGGRIATAGWYVCEGEAIVLAHDDGCCSYHDVANMEEKADYEGPHGLAPALWNDCWLIRAAGPDGRSNKYIVAASAGSALDSGFCSWDFYSKELVAYHSEYQTLSPSPSTSVQSSPDYTWSSRGRISSGSLSCLPLSDGRVSKKFGGSTSLGRPYQSNSAGSYQDDICDSPQWWYRPCGPLMASAGSSLRTVVFYDIRDGDIVMTWNTNRAVTSLDYCSPLQWRNKGKLALAEEEAISIWDVNTMDAQCLQYIELPGKRPCALQIHNADAECSGGVRQRLSSSETEGYDGVCCTQNDVNILDFRVPKGIGIRFPTFGQNFQSVFARGDMILTGGANMKSNKSSECGVHQWSIRKAQPVCTYAFPDSSSHYTHVSLTQIWGSSDTVMAVNGNGLFIFDGGKDAAEGEAGRCIETREAIGTEDLFNPSFDYANSRVLLISRDQPASWRYWPI